jgi:co-chaperonin GroES (HSP10)
MSQLQELIVVGDRVLLKPLSPGNQTNGGLYLPPNVKEKEEVQSGMVVRVGPGYPVPSNQDFDHFLKENTEPVQYIPLQARPGDKAIYLQKAAYELEIDGERLVIVNQNAILLLMRDELGLG